MAFKSFAPIPVFDRLADETLQYILDFAMARESSFNFVYSLLNPEARVYEDLDSDTALESSTGIKDSLYIGYRNGVPLHQHAAQSDHRADWIIVNSTSSRIRALGKVSFFRAKTIVIHAGLPARLQRNEFEGTNRMQPGDQALALSYIRDIVVIDASNSRPMGFLQLPRVLSAFRCLRRCTLLFGHSSYKSGEDNMDWISPASALGGPVPPEMQGLMTGIGVPRQIRLEEAICPRLTWADHWDNMASYIYPMLEVKGALLRAKEARRKEKREEEEEKEWKGKKPKESLVEI